MHFVKPSVIITFAKSCVDSAMDYRTPESNCCQRKRVPDSWNRSMLGICKMFRPTDYSELRHRVFRDASHLQNVPHYGFALTNADKCVEFLYRHSLHDSRDLLRSNLKCTKEMCNLFCGVGSAINRSISVSCTFTRYYFVTLSLY